MQRYLEPVQFENIEEVHVTLCAMLGQRGAELLERIIIKELFRRLSVPYEEKEPFEFETCYAHVKNVRSQWRVSKLGL
jgi:hypothetical protein